MNTDYARYPIRVERTTFGWTVLHYDRRGGLKIYSTSPSLSDAIRMASGYARPYGNGARILVRSPSGESVVAPRRSLYD